MGLQKWALLVLYLVSIFPNTVAIKGDETNGEKTKKRRTSRPAAELPINSHPLHMDEEEINYSQQDEAVRNLVDWFIAEGGYIHPQVEIRRWDRTDPTSYFGAMVNGPVPKDELLIKVPGSIKIQLDDKYRSDKYSYVDSVCELAWTLKKEYELGSDSKYGPYMEYLKTQSKHQIPAMWSDVGKYLITKIQGDLTMMDLSAEATEGSHMHDWIEDYFADEDCLYDPRTGVEMEEWYVAMATQRGYDTCLIPIYDMLNHHNGLVNSITRPSIYDKNGFGVYALQDLDRGDELLYSYHDCPDCKSCEDCGTSYDYWGTAEILRDFGFVEALPQRFYYQEMELYLQIDETSKGFHIRNLDGEWPEDEWVESQIVRLNEMHENDIYPLRNSLPLHELQTIENYHESLLQLFWSYYKLRLEEIENGVAKGQGDDDDDDSESEDESDSEDSEDDESDSGHEEASKSSEDEVLDDQNVEKEEEDVDDFSTEL